jgi:alkylation response protein AidB-like acyl-CoA dehydrogenase
MAEIDLEHLATEVRAWLQRHWDPERSLVEWRDLLVEGRWACPSWPPAWFGRGLPAAAEAVVAAELDRMGAVGPPVGASMALVAPTLLAHGSDDLKRRLLRPILTGEHTWCQLFSEPGSGSDLAGLSTRADRDGDEFVVNGQKVWTTSAHHAQFGMLLARTDWDVPKHLGISYFAFPMDQPGVEVRPLRQMNGRASFNEVFLTDARVSAANVVGELGGGWRVALTTLSHERGLAGHRPRSPRVVTGRTVREAEQEASEYQKTYEWYPQRAGRPDLVVEHARLAGRTNDPLVRQAVAGLLAAEHAARWSAQRAQAARVLGRPPGPEGSLGKLSSSAIARGSAAVHALIGGAQGLLTGPDSTLDGVIAEVHVSVPAVSIAGGTDEVQRNILGERILGLPKDVQVDRDVPFRSVRRS